MSEQIYSPLMEDYFGNWWSKALGNFDNVGGQRGPRKQEEEENVRTEEEGEDEQEMKGRRRSVERQRRKT